MSEIYFAVSSSYTQEEAKELENQGYYVISGRNVMTTQESRNNLVPIIDINEVNPRLGENGAVLCTVDVNFTALLYNLGVKGWEKSKVYRPTRQDDQQRTQRQLGNSHLRLRLSISNDKEDPLRLWYPYVYNWWLRVRKNLGGRGNRPNGVKYTQSSEPLVFNWNKTEILFSVSYKKEEGTNGEYFPAELIQLAGYPPETANLGNHQTAPNVNKNSRGGKFMREFEELYGNTATAPNPSEETENEEVTEEQPF